MSLKIAQMLTELELPTEELVVVGSGILDALGIRPAADIDLVVSEALFEHLQNMPEWVERPHPELKISVLKREPVEAFLTWDDPDLTSNFEALRKDSQEIGGVAFVNLQRLRAWKERQGRDKDVRDIDLIDAYLARS